MAKKFYVVWAGRETGVFTDWPYTKKQVEQFPGARYKSFKTQTEAESAFAGSGAKTPIRATKKPSSSSVSTTITAKNFDVTVYCDGACNPNPGQAGSGVSVYRGEELSELWYGLYNRQGTNNSAELNALHQALLIANENVGHGRTVQIRCDSKYSISCVTDWARSWKKKGWKRKVPGDIKNLEIIQQAHELYTGIKEKVVVSHVKAHIGIEGNELADRMAVFAVVEQEACFSLYAEALDIPKVLAFKAG